MKSIASNKTGCRYARRRFAIRLIVSFAILAALVLLLPTDQLLESLRRVPAPVWALAILAYLLLHLFGAVKWRVMVNAAGGGLGLRDALRCHYYGLFGNTFLSSVVGGDVVRVGLAMKLGRSPTAVATGSVAERALDILALAFVAAIGVGLLPRALDEKSQRLFWGFAILAALTVLAIAAIAWTLRRAPFKLKRTIAKVRVALRISASRPGTIATAFVLGVSLQTLLALLNAWLGRHCGIDISLTAWLFARPMAKISALLPVSQGGLGVREAALAVLLKPLGAPAAMSVAAGLVFQAVIFSGGLVGGILALLLKPKQP